MKKLILYLFVLFMLVLSGCNSTDENTSLLSNLQTSTLDQNSEHNNFVDGVYKDGSQFFIPSPKTTFAQDLQIYNIMTLEERMAQQQSSSQETSNNQQRASVIRKSQKDEQSEDDEGEKKSDDGEDKSEDEDDNSDEDEEKQNDADEEKDDAQDEDDDDGDDDGDSDDDSSSGSSNSSSQSSVAVSSMKDFTTLGDIKVKLNYKDYKFIIARDNYNLIKNFSPRIERNDDLSYSLYVNGYVIENGRVKVEAGVFTIKVNLPNLNTSGDFLIEQNVLTASAENPVYGYVTINARNEQEFEVGISVKEFNVIDKTKTYAFKASFDLVFKTAGMQ